MSRADDHLRSREEPFDFARLRALKRARVLGASEDEVNDAFGIVSTAFGADWLNAAANDIPHGRALPFRDHPIGDLISTSGDEQLAEVIELGRYLRLVALVPGAEALVPALKGSYRPAFFNLAFAAMTVQAGGIVERLEPPAESGRLADIDAVIDGDPVRIECFRPTFKADDHNELYLLAQQALPTSAEDDSPVLSIAIDVRGELTVEMRRKVIGETSRLTRDVTARAHRGEQAAAALWESEDACVSVVRSLPAAVGEPSIVRLADGFTHRQGEPDCFLRTGLANQSDLVGIDATVGAHPTLSHVAVWLPNDVSDWPVTDESVADALAKLGRKIEKKLVQARDSGGRGRVIAVDTWVTRELRRLPGSAMTRLRNKIVEEHAQVRGLLMMRREARRVPPGHEYLLRALTPTNRTPMAADFLERLRRLVNVRLI